MAFTTRTVHGNFTEVKRIVEGEVKVTTCCCAAPGDHPKVCAAAAKHQKPCRCDCHQPQPRAVGK
jgi:hypothetical protein